MFIALFKKIFLSPRGATYPHRWGFVPPLQGL